MVFIFYRNFEFFEFVVFDLLKLFGGCQELLCYFYFFIVIVCYYQMGFVLESLIWWVNLDWVFKFGYDRNQFDQMNWFFIYFMSELCV